MKTQMELEILCRDNEIAALKKQLKGMHEWIDEYVKVKQGTISVPILIASLFISLVMMNVLIWICPN